MQELVAPPGRGRVFTEPPVRPGLADCAPTGRVRLDALARFVQDIAYADADEVGMSRTATWVVRRTRMRVVRFPRFGEHLELTTFCSGLGRMWAERRTSIAGTAAGPAAGAPAGPAAGAPAGDGAADRAGYGAGEVEVVSVWVHLDPVSGRPTPLTQEELAVWSESTAGRKVTARLRHPAPEDPDDSFPWRFRRTECDLADHINNAAYLQPLEEELLQGDEIESIDVEIEYRSPSQAGEKLVLRRGARRWIISPEGEVHASLIVNPPQEV